MRAMKWKPVLEFPEYEVSSSGIVRRGGHLLKLGITFDGYPRCSLRKNGKSYVRRVHTLVAEAFIGPRPKGYDCCHCDGNPSNNDVSNLRWDTRRNNCKDTIKHGKSPKGERSAQSKLTDKAVLDMRKRFAKGEHWSVLVNEYKIGRSHFYFLMRRDRWNHI